MASIVKVKATGKWRARVRRPGAPQQSQNFATRADAAAWARNVESEIERGLWHPDDAATTTTLAAAIDRYASEVLPRMRGQRGESSILRILHDEPVAEQPLSMIHSSDIAVLRDRWSRAGLAPGSVQRRFHTLSHIFTVACREWGMPSLANPVHGVVLPKANDARDRRVSSAELDAICAAGANTRHLTDFVRLAIETACRREALVRLKWADVDLDARTARIRKTKNGPGRTVPLTRAAVALLQRMPRDSERVFAGWSSPDTVTQAFERAVARARKRYVEDCATHAAEPDSKFLVDVRLHDLRHEGISRLAARGIEVHQLARITGHLTLRMLMRYYNPTDKELVALVD